MPCICFSGRVRIQIADKDNLARRTADLLINAGHVGDGNPFQAFKPLRNSRRVEYVVFGIWVDRARQRAKCQILGIGQHFFELLFPAALENIEFLFREAGLVQHFM